MDFLNKTGLSKLMKLIKTALSKKIDIAQGTANEGKALIVGADGNVSPEKIGSPDFTGTTAEVEAAIKDGTIEDGMIVNVTDDWENISASNVTVSTIDGLDASNTQDALAALSKKVKSTNWLPSNGYNPLSAEEGLFVYSVNPSVMISQGCPNSNFSEYATVYGCNSSEYEILIYVDVFGRVATWSTNQNVWDVNSLSTSDKTPVGAINEVMGVLSASGLSSMRYINDSFGFSDLIKCTKPTFFTNWTNTTDFPYQYGVGMWMPGADLNYGAVIYMPMFDANYGDVTKFTTGTYIGYTYNNGTQQTFRGWNKLPFGSYHTVLSATLVTGETSLTFSSDKITTSSVFDIYTSIWGESPTAVTVSTGSIVLTFDALSSDMTVQVEVH